MDATFQHTVDLRRAMHVMKVAWEAVHPDIVINGFIKAGFKNASLSEINDTIDHSLIEDFDAFVDIDERLLSEDSETIETDDEVGRYNICNLIDVGQCHYRTHQGTPGRRGT